MSDLVREDDDTVEDGGLEGGVSETNLSQLPCFTTLKLGGRVRFTGPYICMCFVREGQLAANVIRVSFTSCCRSMLSAELLLHHSASAVAFQMLWAQCKEWLNSFTCFLSLPSSSPSLLLIYSVLSSGVVPLSGQRNCTLILPVATLPIFPQTNSKWRMCFLYLWYNLNDITWDKT